MPAAALLAFVSGGWRGRIRSPLCYRRWVPNFPIIPPKLPAISQPREAAMTAGPLVVGLGEALFDVFPDREILGGAPLNVAVQAHQLLAPWGGQGLPVSRIGHDERGKRLQAELAGRGIPLIGLQLDPEHPTGTVLVTRAGTEPQYEIVEGVAWDFLEWTDHLEELADQCHAVTFGTLGQRSEPARSTVQRFVMRARQALRLFDVNLRQHFYDAELLRQSCELATVVKLNEHELPIVHQALGLPNVPDAFHDEVRTDRMVEDMMAGFMLDAVALTRGARGTVLYQSGQKVEGEAVHYPAADQADGVGAGDACSAGLIVGMLTHRHTQEVVDLANHLGAYVASQSGATPTLPQELIARVTQP